MNLDDCWYFTPSPDEPGLLHDDYGEEDYTVLAIHSLLQAAFLPVETFIFAALMVQSLNPAFYKEWHALLYDELTGYGEQTKELVVISAIVLSHCS